MVKTVQTRSKNYLTSVLLAVMLVGIYLAIILISTNEIEKLEDSNKMMEIENNDLRSLIESIENKMSSLKSDVSALEKENLKLTKQLVEKLSTVEENAVNLGTFSMTHYVADCEGCTGITYEGIDVRNTIYYKNKRVVAVDPNVVPLGSILEITMGDVTFKAQALDIGSEIKGKDLDLLVETRSEAFKKGRIDVQVKMLREGW